MKNNNSILDFLKITLDFIQYADQCGNLKDLYFVYPNGEKEFFVDLQKKTTSFLKIVYQCIQKGKIEFYSGTDMFTFDFLPIAFSTDIEFSSIISEVENGFSYALDSFMVDTGKLQQIVKYKDTFIQNREELLKYQNIFEIPKIVGDHYLDSYYKFLACFIILDDFVSKKIFHPLLLLDTYYNQNNEFSYSFYSPIFLKKILDIRNEIDSICFQLNDVDFTVYKDAFLEKVKNSFQCNLLNERDVMCISNLVDGNIQLIENENYIFPFDDSISVDSFHIPALYSNQCKQENRVAVSIVGHVTSKVIEKLYDKLANQHANDLNNKKLIFQVYSDSDIHVDTQYEDFIYWMNSSINPLESKGELEKIVESSDSVITFFSTDFEVKCNELLKKHRDYLKNRFIFDDYLHQLDELVFFVSSYYSKTGLDNLEGMDNKVKFLDFIGQISHQYDTLFYAYYYECNDKNTIDIKETVFCQNYLSRTLPNIYQIKNTNYKNILQYYNYSDSYQLPNSSSSITFSLGEFYKNIICDDTLFLEFSNRYSKFFDTILSIDYHNERKRFDGSYYSESLMGHHQILEHLEEVFWPIFYGSKSHTNYHNIHKRIGAFLFNHSSSANDLLFTYFYLKDDFNSSYSFQKIDHQPEYSLDKSSFFSYKWIYNYIIENFGMTTDLDGGYYHFFFQYLDRLKENKLITSKTITEISNFILSACESSNLGDYYLKQHAKELKQKRI